MQDQQKIKEASQKSQFLINDLKEKLKLFAEQNIEVLCLDQRKILKLFNYSSWTEYMKWIEEKVTESSDVQSQKLSQIVQEQAQFQQSINQTFDRNSMKFTDDKTQSQLLAIQNAKLRKENINLQNKIQELSSFYKSGRKSSSKK